jgi:hypothetical protein
VARAVAGSVGCAVEVGCRRADGSTVESTRDVVPVDDVVVGSSMRGRCLYSGSHYNDWIEVRDGDIQSDGEVRFDTTGPCELLTARRRYRYRRWVCGAPEMGAWWRGDARSGVVRRMSVLAAAVRVARDVEALA